MYKPGTQLILNDLWAAAAADKLGFSVTTVFEDLDGSITRRGHFYTSSHPESTETLVHWRITVTESGPNAVKKFLPQVDDVLRGLSMPDKYAGMISKDFMLKWLRAFSAVKIIERDGIPFPKFSEVIEP